MPSPQPPLPCPRCALPLPSPGTTEEPTVCPRCGLSPDPSLLARLRGIDAELWGLQARWRELLGQRADLIAQLTPLTAPAAPRVRPGSEMRQSTPQHVLLALGGILLAVAALAFTLFSWGSMSLGARASVLLLVTVAAVAAPVLLLRRSLTATAECVAGLGLLLLLLDAYALHEVALPAVDGWAYWGTVTAVLAAGWAAYGTVLPGRGLVLSGPSAVCLAQLPPLLWAAGAEASVTGFAWVLTATAGCDVALALHARRARTGTRGTAAVAATLLGGGALLWAVPQSAWADGWGEAVRAGGLLLAVAAVAGYAAVRHRPLGVPLAVVAGLLLVGAAGGMLRPALPSGTWWVPGYLVCGAALLVAARWARPAHVRTGLLSAAGTVHAGALLWTVPAVAHAVLGPSAWADKVWEGAPGSAAEALTPGTAWPGDGAVPAVLGVLTLVLLGAARFAPEAGHRARAAAAAVVTGSAALLVLPPAAGWSYRAGVAVALGTSAVLVVASALPRVRARAAGPARAALLTGTVLACTATAWSLAEEGTTLLVLAVLAGVLTAAAALVPGSADRAVAAGAAVSAVAGLAGAVPASLEVRAHWTAFCLLAVAAAAQWLAAAALRTDRVTGPVVEAAGAAAAVAGLVLAAGSGTALSTALAVCGLIAAGSALRADRRPAATVLGAVLTASALWVRLATWGVTAPEAYALPVAAAGLGLGVLRRRRDPRPSSWVAYGPGLATALLPSLVALWGEAGWVRPLLLGAAALAVTLAGARWRLQAPLLLGGGVLALVGVHELAPYLVEVFGLVPRWVTPALGGLLLLAVGATYEQRLRDARHLRDRLARMG